MAEYGHVHSVEFLDLMYPQRPINNNFCILKLQKKNLVTYQIPSTDWHVFVCEYCAFPSGVCFNGEVRASEGIYIRFLLHIWSSLSFYCLCRAVWEIGVLS